MRGGAWCGRGLCGHGPMWAGPGTGGTHLHSHFRCSVKLLRYFCCCTRCFILMTCCNTRGGLKTRTCKRHLKLQTNCSSFTTGLYSDYRQVTTNRWLEEGSAHWGATILPLVCVWRLTTCISHASVLDKDEGGDKYEWVLPPLLPPFDSLFRADPPVPPPPIPSLAPSLSGASPPWLCCKFPWERTPSPRRCSSPHSGWGQRRMGCTWPPSHLGTLGRCPPTLLSVDIDFYWIHPWKEQLQNRKGGLISINHHYHHHHH